MVKPIDRDRLRKLLGMLGSGHDGEVLNAARLITDLLRNAGTSWASLLPDEAPAERPDGDLGKLDQLMRSEKVSDVMKLRFGDMRAALFRGRLSDADRRLIRVLHRKAVIDGVLVET